MATTKEIAADIARELRQHPHRWTQGCWARDINGKCVGYGDEAAACWCLEGHIVKRGGNTGTFGHIAKTARGNETGLAKFNDDKYRTVFDIIALCDSVAASVRCQPIE